MSATQATIPDLERQLVAAARRAGARGRIWRRPVALGALVAVVGVGAAAAGVLTRGTEIDRGEASAGTYVVKIKRDTKSTPDDEICLQMRLVDAHPAYGCGVKPTAAKPFGVLVVSATPPEVPASEPNGALTPDRGRTIPTVLPTEQVVYGLVSPDVATVSVLGSGAEHFDTQTVEKEDLPGRYFSVVTPYTPRVEIVGYDASGAETTRIGSRSEPDHQPLSHDDAVAMGDPAGFAPTAVPIRHFTYDGQRISAHRASDLDLVCDEGTGVCS